jgi:hypothetical protein
MQRGTAMDVSRYELNRRVRTILIRHDVNLAQIDYSFIGGTVYLSGEINKSMDGEFTPSGIEQVAREISGLSGVRDIQFDLQNWVIASSGLSWQIMKRKKKAPDLAVAFSQGGGAVSTDDTVHIEKGENIIDVLKDIDKDKSDKENQ